MGARLLEGLVLRQAEIFLEDVLKPLICKDLMQKGRHPSKTGWHGKNGQVCALQGCAAIGRLVHQRRVPPLGAALVFCFLGSQICLSPLFGERKQLLFS